MMKLTTVYDSRLPFDVVDMLYNLLKEREPHQSISHKEMPTIEQHAAFIRTNPYLNWYIVMVDGEPVGAVYLTRQREIGIAIFKQYQGMGYGKSAVRALMFLWPGEKFLANINPANQASIAFFAKLGAKHIQNTYSLGE